MTSICRALALTLSLLVTLAAPALAQKRGGDLVVGQTAGTNTLDPHFTASAAAREHDAGHVRDPRDDRRERLAGPDAGGEVGGARQRPDLPLRAPQGGQVPQRQGDDRGRCQGVAGALRADQPREADDGPRRVHRGARSVRRGDPAQAARYRVHRSAGVARVADDDHPSRGGDEGGQQDSHISTGPYQFVEWIPDSHVKLKRFESYVPNTAASARDGLGGRKTAYFDTVTIRIIKEASARVAALGPARSTSPKTSPSPRPSASRPTRSSG